MGKSFFLKLLGAFAVVIVVLAVVAIVLINNAAANEFKIFTDRNGQVLAERIAPALADFYSQNQSWDGISNLLQDSIPTYAPAREANPASSPLPPQATAVPTQRINIPTLIPPTSPATMGRGMGRSGSMGMGMAPTSIPVYPTSMPGTSQLQNPSGSAGDTTSRAGMGPRMRSGMGNSSYSSMELWSSMMGNRVVIADGTGRVVSDSSGQPVGSVLTSEQLAAGQPIQVSGQSAGTVLVESTTASPGTPAGDFLRAMNRSILIAVLVAGSVALLLGGILFFQMTAPVRKLKMAAGAIAAGDLSKRVQVRSGDELNDLALAFNHMAENLNRMEAQRQQMCADIAHELRTPLSVMQANLEAMEDGVLPLEVDEISSLHEETVLLGRLVADLHLLSVAEAGQLKLEPMEVDPGELIQKSAERLMQTAQNGGVDLKIETPANLRSIQVDAGRISQVIGNLISNSLRYTNPGGCIQVGLAERPQTTNSPGRSHLVVSVTDTGSGIPEQDLPYIFDRFYRADKSRNRASGGSGLGLAIAKYIIEAHRGTIWAESPVWKGDMPQGPGTRISFTLPY
jgi:two-component system OmpR family sensor kinase/two-component system sensor histidine kinase BaeS